MAATIYYDGKCPFCHRYVSMVRLRNEVGEVQLIDLRNHTAQRHELLTAGFDLDQGMVFELDGLRKGGQDALLAISMLTTPSTLLNRLSLFLISSPAMASLLYPLMRSGRWITLFFMGRQGLMEDDQGTAARTMIFARFFALFSIFHFFNYALEYQRFPPGADQAALLFAALALFFRPQSARLLFLLMLASTISTVIQAPTQSNHTIVRTALLLGYWLSFVTAWIRGSSWQAIFVWFAPAGQGALLVMYFFGIFHKINTDFLNPTSSCAVTLWSLMPAPLVWLNGPWMDYLAIYGTFVVEGALMIMLLTSKWRHAGIALGILFHMLLALSDYAMYISFTMLSITMHVLYLNGEAAQRILASSEWKLIQNRVKEPLYIAAFSLLIFLLAVAGTLRFYSLVTIMALPIILPFCWLVLRYGYSRQPLSPRSKGLPTLSIGAITSLLLFLNCMVPYFGLKSAQAINMFANLRLEGDVSNHLIMPKPGPFTYLDNVAVINDPGDDPLLAYYKANDFAIIYYQLLTRLEEMPNNSVSFTLGDQIWTNVRAQDLKEDINTILHPPWFRKWFHFQPVLLVRPEPCHH